MRSDFRRAQPGASLADVRELRARDVIPREETDADADAALVARMAAGDRDALAELYDRHSALLYSLAVRVLQDRREAEDLLHDVILEVWRSAAQYSPERGRVVVWLTMRMRSRALDRLKSPSRRRTALSEDPAAEQVAPASTSPDACVDHRAAREALDQLPAEQRRVLELAYFEGLSSTEIAAELKLSVGTVKSRTAAGLSKLRARLKDGGTP